MHPKTMDFLHCLGPESKEELEEGRRGRGEGGVGLPVVGSFSKGWR